MGSVLQTAMALVIVTIFAVAGFRPGADPVLRLTNLATLCVIALMVFASFAVVVHFRGKLTGPKARGSSSSCRWRGWRC